MATTPCSKYLVSVTNAAQPITQFAKAVSTGPYIYNGNLYVLMNKVVNPGIDNTLISPQFWKSPDAGKTWTPLPTETTQPWGTKNGNVCAWNPNYGVNIFTFYIGGVLIDFDLSTETWGPAYATNTPNPYNNFGSQILIRLSDGRLRLLYDIQGTALYWVTANTGGSGQWDSVSNILISGKTSPVYMSACFDPLNTTHAVFSYMNISGVHVYEYVQINSANVVSTPATLAFPDGTSISNIVAAPDGQLYFAYVDRNPNDTNSLSKEIRVWVGSNFTAPVWTSEQAVAYVYNGTTQFYIPLYQAWMLGIVQNELTLMWSGEFGTGGAHDTRWKQRISGAWDAEQIHADYQKTFPAPPLQPSGQPASGPPAAWQSAHYSFCACSPALNNMAVLVFSPTQTPDGKNNNTSFFVLPPCPNNFIGMGNALMSDGNYIV